MHLNFTKMHGLGNDFMVLDLVRQHTVLTHEQIRIWSNRKTGIGFDQLLLVEPTTQPGCDFAYRIYNADGGKVEQCGNGARCVARFVVDQGLTAKSELTFAMATGSIDTSLLSNNQVKVGMGAPILTPATIPFLVDAQALTYPIQVGGKHYEISAVSMGNPHAVVLVADVDTTAVAELGPLLEHHPLFPQQTNAGFMQIIDTANIRLRVFERGAGETLACGTGACAAVVAGRLRELLTDDVNVHTHGGTLRIRWEGGQNCVWMTGPTATVFEGKVTI